MLAGFGIPGELAGRLMEAATVEVFPENAVALDVFSRMQTQWRIGPTGATGLDYAALPIVMEAVGVKKKARPDVFARVQVIEQEVLRLLDERRSKTR